ncbi:MAG: glycogen synthase [Clostridia bacterium]|nr:glycogen synthase [Clostridia bacterium]
MDRRLSILIKEIKKSSRNSGSSILSLINLDKKDKKPVSEKATSNIVNIADAKPKILDNSYEKRKTEVKNESVALDTETKSITPSVEKEVVIEKHITQVEKEIPIEHVLENKVEKEDIEDKKASAGVSEELKRMAMTGMKLTKSTKARQKEYSKAKKLEDKKKKALEKEAKERIKKEQMEKAKNPNTPFGALSLSMDRLDDEMKKVMAKIDEDIIDIKNGLPNVLTEEEQESIELAEAQERMVAESKLPKEELGESEVQVANTSETANEVEMVVASNDCISESGAYADTAKVEVETCVEKEEVVVLDEDQQNVVTEPIDEENVVSNDMVKVASTVACDNKNKNNDKKSNEGNEVYDITQFVRHRGEREMDRAYDRNKVNQYAKILEEVSSEVHDEKNKEVEFTEKQNITSKMLNDVKTAINPAVELKPMRILYVCSECQPFIATGGLADVAGSLPEAIRAANPYADMRVIMPLYSDIKEEYKSQFEYITNFTVHLSWRQQYCGIFKYVKNNVTYYFLDNEYYFKRKGSYGYYDDGERYAFFSKAVVDALNVLDYFPHVMHCNDWQSALCSIYVKTGYQHDYRYAGIKHVFTIHNIQYQGRFGMHSLVDLFGIDPRHSLDLDYDGDINLVKAAIQYSDFFTTVSPSYCDDLKQEEHSYGLHYEIVRQQNKLRGILNGIDYTFYSPSVDECIYRKYDINSIDKKVENKLIIQKEYGLPISKHTPLIVMATRLVSHKGLDLISRIMDEVLKDDVQFMIVGTGDDKYIEYFKSLEARHKDKVKALVGQYSNPIARKLYAAGDIYIMPSKNEPCGLSQMISSIYGCVPIVRETGGLKDSIKDFGCIEGGNGYTFTHYNAHDLLYSIRRAVSDYQDREEWKKKMKIVMKVDFSWNKPAKDYLSLYNQLV